MVRRTRGTLNTWNSIETTLRFPDVSAFASSLPKIRMVAHTKLLALLHQAEQNLEIKNDSSVKAIIPTGNVFDFFNEVRKILNMAKKDVFFIDPYLDAEFVERYMPQIEKNVPVRLLTSDSYIKNLIPAVNLYSKQTGTPTIIKTSKDFHDRYLLIDNAKSFQCGGSFKDGAVKAPASLIQTTDTFSAIRDTYENLWASAKQEN